MIRPERLHAGDTVALVSPSWGGPALFPDQFNAGLRVLADPLGLRVREYPTTRMPPDELHRRPDLRARDLEAAFCDPEVKAIFASIGGEESIRLLPRLDPAIAREHPTLLMGFSDITTLMVFYAQVAW
jgi:muramoyltetrapeptide carboxypeptidase LdcA involved in peptidoglycan recycling